MDLIIVTGFLGSGKTTLLNGIAKMLSRNNKKVAIIENEMRHHLMQSLKLRAGLLMARIAFV